MTVLAAPAPCPPAARSQAAGWRVAGLRLGLLLGLAAVLAAVDLPGRPQTLCLLRAATGVPCPLCGSTTAAVAIGQGRPLSALAASPLAVLGAAALVLAPLRGLLRGPQRLRAVLDRAWSVLSRRRTAAVLTLLGLSQAWQLLRLP